MRSSHWTVVAAAAAILFSSLFLINGERRKYHCILLDSRRSYGDVLKRRQGGIWVDMGGIIVFCGYFVFLLFFFWRFFVKWWSFTEQTIILSLIHGIDYGFLSRDFNEWHDGFLSWYCTVDLYLRFYSKVDINLVHFCCWRLCQLGFAGSLQF